MVQYLSFIYSPLSFSFLSYSLCIDNIDILEIVLEFFILIRKLYEKFRIYLENFSKKFRIYSDRRPVALKGEICDKNHICIFNPFGSNPVYPCKEMHAPKTKTQVLAHASRYISPMLNFFDACIKMQIFGVFGPRKMDEEKCLRKRESVPALKTRKCIFNKKK
ncbi:hypothetical protein BpHYR1_023771 [Brachionus plicatilis]|uniref:Uncharacterized protein n=1 Tax=Brachionus plicatilis TaxID=10195 RepID=A0A3M7SMU9_BRAPC|nr:hypothetical protein BpHYR1_023771 [Brachionus plicatilis]